MMTHARNTKEMYVYGYGHWGYEGEWYQQLLVVLMVSVCVCGMEEKRNNLGMRCHKLERTMRVWV